jgi:transposase-like protein/IS1 family transposase
MTIQNVIRLCLVVMLAWLLMQVHWPLLVREWKQQQKRRRAKRRKQTRKGKKPKAFEGLTRQPVCERCVAEAERQDKETKREPPAKINHKRGRRREVDTRKQFCPEERCQYYGWLDRGNIISNGHPSGGQWRQLKCVACGKHFQETIGTIFYGSSVPAQDIMRAIVGLCEGVSPRKVARIFEVDKDTVFSWLVEAASHSETVIGYMVHNLHLSQVQMDELYALLNGMREEGEGRSCCWVWVATDPLSKLLIAIEVGDRSLDMAQQLVHTVVGRLALGVVPLFLTDQLAAYGKALLAHFGYWVERVSEKSGRILHRWMPVEQLQYAQVKKRRRRRKIVAVTTKVVFGTKEAVRAALRTAGHRDQCGCCASVAFVERLNRTLRAHVPGLGRREEGLAKTKVGLRRRLILVMGYYNLCLPHLSLRQAMPSPIPTKGNGSPKKWIPRTPAMAGGITDHIWSMEEFLLFRVPPWRQEVAAA